MWYRVRFQIRLNLMSHFKDTTFELYAKMKIHLGRVIEKNRMADINTKLGRV